MKKLILILAVVSLTGCSTVKKYWPKAHDPVMFNQLVAADLAIENQNCEAPTWKEVAPITAQLARYAEWREDPQADPTWKEVAPITAQLARYAEWREDPQADNLKGLHAHVERMSKGGSKMFCEIGKKTGRQRIEAARSAWEGR